MNESTIGSYIRTLRLQKGLTQLALANLLHVTDKAVSKWERGLSYPDILLLPKLADVLDVSVADLIRESNTGDDPARLLHRYEMTSDLRAPLHIILGCADLLESSRTDADQFAHYLEILRISSRFLLSALDPDSSGHPAETLEDLLNTQTNDREEEYTKNDFDFTGKRILIVEDIEVNREIAGRILKETGADLEYAEDGCVCLDRITIKAPGYYDLILMDIMMPNLNGIEATRRIRRMEDPLKADIPIIAMTANASGKDRREAFEAGMNAFTEKPVILDKLLRTIREFL